MGRERNQRSEYSPRKTGIRNTATPKSWSPRSLTVAPTTPIQLWAGLEAGGVAAVFRRIERRIRYQCEDKEDREDQHQEADQLIEPPVGRRSKSARSDCHVGVRPCHGTTSLARTHAACSVQRGHTFTFQPAANEKAWYRESTDAGPPMSVLQPVGVQIRQSQVIIPRKVSKVTRNKSLKVGE